MDAQDNPADVGNCSTFWNPTCTLDEAPKSKLLLEPPSPFEVSGKRINIKLTAIISELIHIQQFLQRNVIHPCPVDYKRVTQYFFLKERSEVPNLT